MDREPRRSALRRAARAVRHHAHPQEQGRLALRRRAAAAGDRPLPGQRPGDHPARRAVHRHRPGDDREHPEDHPRPEGPRHLDPDHRPPGPRDAADHRPQLRHRRRGRSSATARRPRCWPIPRPASSTSAPASTARTRPAQAALLAEAAGGQGHARRSGKSAADTARAPRCTKMRRCGRNRCAFISGGGLRSHLSGGLRFILSAGCARVSYE